MNILSFLQDSILDIGMFIVLSISINSCLTPKRGKWYLRLPLFAVYALQALAYVILSAAGATDSPPSVIDLFAWICRMLLVSLLYEGSRARNIAIYALFSFSNILSRLVMYQIFLLPWHRGQELSSLAGDRLPHFILVVLVFMVMAALFVLLLKKIAIRHLDSPAFSKMTALFCSTVNVSYFILFPIITSFYRTVSLEAASVLFIGLMSAVFVIIAAAFITARERSKRRRALEQNAMLRSQMEQQYQHFLEMQKADAELHKLRHDISNHMLVLKDMLEHGTGAPAEYVDKLTARYESATTAFICRNMIFSSVLNRQRDICLENSVEFNYQIDVPPTLEISNLDMMSVLSNLLSNAVNASLSVSEKKRRYVYLSARLSAGVLAIAIENSCPLPGEELPRAEEEGSHGWGTKIIKEIAEKYGGVFKLQIIKDKAFSSVTMLNKKL